MFSGFGEASRAGHPGKAGWVLVSPHPPRQELPLFLWLQAAVVSEYQTGIQHTPAFEVLSDSHGRQA